MLKFSLKLADVLQKNVGTLSICTKISGILSVFIRRIT